MFGGARKVVTGLLVGALALGAAQTAFAAAPSLPPSPPSGSATPATSAPSSPAPTWTVAAPTEDTDPDAAWSHAEHHMPNNAVQPTAASAAAGPVNAGSQNLPYSGGPVILNPAVYLIFWGPQWINGSVDARGHLERQTANYVDDFFSGVGGSPWLNSVTQYCQDFNPVDILRGVDCSKVAARDRITNPRNLVLTAIFDPRAIPKKLDDTAVRKEVRTIWRQQNSNNKAIYFVFTPSGFVTSDLGPNCGYHGWMSSLVNRGIRFSYMPYQSDPNLGCFSRYVNSDALGTVTPYNDGTLDGFSIVGGHELAEAITDPDVRGPLGATIPAWTTLEGANSKENGDLCHVGVGPWDTPYGNIWLPAGSDASFHAFAVQALWSQADHGCPLGYPLRAVVPAADNGALVHTTIDVQNRGSATGSFSIQYFDSRPSAAASLPEDAAGFGDGNMVLRSGATWSVPQAPDHHSLPAGASGGAMVYGLAPVQVTVRQSAGSGHDPSAYAAVRPGAGTGTILTASDVDFDGTAAAQATTRLSVVNGGPTRTNFSVEFRDPAGTVIGTTPPYLLHTGAALAVTPGDAGIQGAFTGTATIRSAAGDSTHQDIESLPLAAAVTIDRKPGDALSTYLATPTSGPFGAGTRLYAPLLYGPPPASGGAIARLAVGQSFTLAVTSAGTVVAWGTDNRGQLGDNNNQPVRTPIAVPGLSQVVSVAAGLTQSFALTVQGAVYAWGFNGDGELGLGDTTDRYSPTLVPGLPVIAAIAAGANHTLALDSTGQVWAWGYNGDGELGDGTIVSSLSPEAVPNLFAVQIAGGLNFSIAIDAAGQVRTWGGNDYGQLGDGTTTPNPVPTQVAGLPVITQISAGLRQSYALDVQGHPYAWGLGQAGELGNGQTGLLADSHTPARMVGTDGVTPLTGVQVVASGFGARAFALMANGTVLGWGSSPFGALGTGAGSADTGTPAPVLTGAGGGTFGPLRAIGVGYQHTVAVEPDGSGWSWGFNFFGELGSGSPAESVAFPAPIPALPGTGAGGGGGSAPFSSRLVLADPADSAAAVTITYFDAGGTSTSRQVTVPAHGQVVVSQSSPDGPPTSSNPYTAVVTSDEGLAAAAEILPTDTASARASAYNLFLAGGVAIGVPAVQHGGAGQLSTALLLMGLDGAAQVTVTYLNDLGVAIKSVTLTVPANGVAIADQTADLGPGSVASATVAAVGKVAVLEVGSGDTGLTSVSLP